MSAHPTAGALCYLGTPYSRFPRGIHAAFIAACKLTGQLLRTGVNCYSPIVATHMVAIYGEIDPLEHAIWLPFDEAIMARCDTLLVAHLDGWQDSYGIAHEVKFFERAMKPIFDLDPLTLAMTQRPRQRPPRDRYDGLFDAELQAQTNDYLNGDVPLAHGKSASEQGGASS